jgi:serine phosphatase RsbU (regulator of sigma subunit)
MGARKATGHEAGAFPASVASAGDGLVFDFLDDTPAGVGLLDPELRWVYVNAEFLRVTGLDRARVLGRPLTATPFALDEPAVRRVLAEDGLRGTAVDGAVGTDPSGGSGEWHVRYQRLEVDHQVVGVIAAVSDASAAGGVPAVGGAPGVSVSDVSVSDMSVSSVSDVPADHRRSLDLARRRLALQHAAAERIGTTLDLDMTCAELAEFTVPALADLATVQVMPHDVDASGPEARSGPPRMRRAALACAPGLRRRLGCPASPTPATRARDGSVLARSLREGRPVVANLQSDAQLADVAATPEALTAYRLAGVDSVLAVPLTARGRLVGAMTLARVRGRSRGFAEDDVALVRDLADRAAVSIENARQHADSQSITLELQRALLVEPGRPHSNLDVAARYLPSGNSALVGGDWYEIVRLPFGRTLLVMGDVMGHGVEAAVDMSTYRSAIRDAGGMDLPPRGILKHLDRLICDNESARPATCLLGVADPNRGRLTFASAGHLPPALFAAGRRTELAEVPTGPPLGTGLGDYEQAMVDMSPDHVLLLYTDGLVERRDEDIDVSLARLAALGLPASGRLEDLLDAALREVAPDAAEDDIALLAVRAAERGG